MPPPITPSPHRLSSSAPRFKHSSSNYRKFQNVGTQQQFASTPRFSSFKPSSRLAPKGSTSDGLDKASSPVVARNHATPAYSRSGQWEEIDDEVSPLQEIGDSARTENDDGVVATNKPEDRNAHPNTTANRMCLDPKAGTDIMHPTNLDLENLPFPPPPKRRRLTPPTPSPARLLYNQFTPAPPPVSPPVPRNHPILISSSPPPATISSPSNSTAQPASPSPSPSPSKPSSPHIRRSAPRFRLPSTTVNAHTSSRPCASTATSTVQPTATAPPQRAPVFLFPPSISRAEEATAAEEEAVLARLLFSPHRAGKRGRPRTGAGAGRYAYVRGGMAEGVRDWVMGVAHGGRRRGQGKSATVEEVRGDKEKGVVLVRGITEEEEQEGEKLVLVGEVEGVGRGRGRRDGEEWRLRVGAAIKIGEPRWEVEIGGEKWGVGVKWDVGS